MNKNLITIEESIKDNNLRVSLIPPSDYKNRTNSNICCVVDVSGSMDAKARITSTNQTSTENYALSILDVVKHAIKMIVNTLNSDDYLSVITFSSSSSVLFDLLPMNDGNKIMVIEQIERLCAGGSTQLWQGLHEGLQTLLMNNTPNKNQSIFVLTDGDPTDKGIDVNLINFKKTHPKFNCTINTFGFSDNSNSDLLNTLALQYNGMFSFIPDASLIATAFANALANTLTVYTNNALLHIVTNKCELKLPDSQPCIWKEINKEGQQEVVIDVGVINTQQARDFIFEIVSISEDSLHPFAEVKLTYEESFSLLADVKNIDNLPKSVSKSFISREEDYQPEINNHIYRYKVISAIENSIDQFKKNPTISQQVKSKLMDLIEEMEGHLSENDRHFEGIYKDLVRTVSEAFSSQEKFQKWGHHYLLSLKRAHLIQQCNTYKDPGVQHYGKSLFQQIKAIADEIFVKMPPPKPYSNSSSYNNNNHIQSQQSYSQAYNMVDYHNYSQGGCIHGDSLVYLSNGTTKKASQIKKGEMIVCPTLGIDSQAEVECVVISYCDQRVYNFVQMGDNLWLTPKHPIRINNEWIHPKSIGEIIQKPSDMIYQFVLKNGHTMNIGGFEVICLGHGFQEPIAQHDYLGSQAVIQDLQKMKGWNEGRVIISSRIRDIQTGKVTAFTQ